MGKNLKTNKEKHALLMRWATYFSVFVAVFLIGLKLLGWRLTGSISLLATLVDSLLDCVASIINLIAVRQSLRPADKEHRFGHGKAEALAALGQSLFIIGSGLFLFYECINTFFSSHLPGDADIGIKIMLVSMGTTLLLIFFQSYVIKKTASLAIAADSAHYKTDFLINLGVIVSLLLTAWAKNRTVEIFFVLGVMGYIAYSGYKLMREAINILMDHEWPEEERQEIMKIILAHEAVAGVHDLRTRQAGAQNFIQFHLEMRGEYSLHYAHQVAEEVEKSILKEFPNCEILIHQDPIRARN